MLEAEEWPVPGLPSHGSRSRPTPSGLVIPLAWPLLFLNLLDPIVSEDAVFECAGRPIGAIFWSRPGPNPEDVAEDCMLLAPVIVGPKKLKDAEDGAGEEADPEIDGALECPIGEVLPKALMPLSVRPESDMFE